jgi:anti-sigma factor ChrR (cupin superfamily)
MPAVTPNAKGHEGLAALASRYVNVAELPWAPTRFPGVDLKILMEDKETGLLTALTRFAPGAVLPVHEHVEIEQSYVLEGALEDDEGAVSAGNYVWRPAGSRHVARAPAGCTVLSFFLKPNRFFDQT